MLNASCIAVNYAEYHLLPSGEVALIGRVKYIFVTLHDMTLPDRSGRHRSHPDVAQRHYPELFKQYFPDGLPAHGLAY